MNDTDAPVIDNVAPEVASTGSNSTPAIVDTPSEKEQENEDISKLESSNIAPTDEPVKWRGDSRYFQTGKKQGQLKPSASVGGLDAQRSFDGINTDIFDEKKATPNHPSRRPKN